MSSVFFESAARVISQVFDWLQSSGQSATSNLITDTFQTGIDNATGAGEGFTLVPGTSPLSVTVEGQGIAYDPTGARIFISSSDTTLYNTANLTQTTNDGLGNPVPTPQSTGCVNIPLTGGSFNYVWINYLATTDITVFTLNKVTNAKIFYKLTDGYNIQVTTTNVPPNSDSVFLGAVNLTSIVSGIIPSSAISQIGRTYFNVLPNIVPITTAQANRADATATYNPASTYVLETHIKAVGTGTVNAVNPHGTSLADLGVSSLDTVIGHRQLEHGVGGGLAAANAIIAGVPGTPSPSTSAMASSINIVNPGSDYLTIHQLLTTEFALINGTAFNVTNIFGTIPADAHIFFPNVSGTYNVYWDSVVKAFSETISDISADPTKLWLCTITYTYVGSSPSDHNALSGLIDRRRIGSSTHLLQRWITGARPGSGSTAAVSGEFGFNLTTGLMEYWDGSAWQQPVNSSSHTTVPTGTLLPFAGASAPSGFLLADGASYTTSAYPNLFAVIGYIYGGSGGNFSVPNMTNNVPIGAGSIASFGVTAGAATQTPIQNPHTHTENSHTHNQANTGGIVNVNVSTNLGIYDVSGNPPSPSGLMGATSTAGGNPLYRLGAGTGSQSDTGMSNTTATNNTISIVQPSLGVTYIIKY